MNSLGFEPMTCLSFRNNTAQLHKVKLFTTCSWSQDTMPQSLKINDFLCFVATEHCMCWRPLYGSGLMWDFWLMFNRQPVSNCRAMTHGEPAGYRTNTHTNARKTLICTSSLLPCSRVCVTSICMNHTHSIQPSGHPVCPDTGRLFLNCNMSVSFFLSFLHETRTTNYRIQIGCLSYQGHPMVKYQHVRKDKDTRMRQETAAVQGRGPGHSTSSVSQNHHKEHKAKQQNPQSELKGRYIITVFVRVSYSLFGSKSLKHLLLLI